METENKDQSEEGSKTWWQKLVESISGNVELIKSFAALLANPMIVSSLMVGFVCWIFKSKENSEGLREENKELRAELDRIYRKHKKLKKKYKKARQNSFPNPSAQTPCPNERDRPNNFGSVFLT